MSKWARVIVNLKKKTKRGKQILYSVVLRLRFCVEKASSKHLWFQSPFLLFSCCSQPYSFTFSHSCPDWIISLCSSICIIIKLVIFFQTFLSLNFIPRGKYDYSALRSFTFEVLQFESIPLSGRSHIWLFQSPTVKLSHHLQ